MAHIEAGLRSFNKYMPEEINRILTSNVSTLLFCPSKTAVTNLIYDGYKNILNEGELVEIDFLLQNKIKLNIKADKNEPLVINVGDVMYDVLLYALKIAEERSDAIDKLQLFGKQYYLLTLHRAEITDDTEKLHEIIDFVNDVSVNKRVVFPMHPRMKNVYKIAKNKLNQNVEIIKPMSYLDMLMLMKNSDLIMTDSGGMQKEAYWLKIPCITLRDETEWIETVQSGWNVLYKNYCGLRRPVKNDGAYYGDGKSSERIVSVLAEKLIEDKL
ncbi:MAG: UDP-N-acetylglucosamine 2-epimerase [Candidatus Scalindua brodae]|uniref:UDP-N-acetylglucosamine 2-epimerase n=1 Tax=Candidatus Scalindua brodae TaxID=237368 RepID=A0A0B0ELM7_9BACT|nr:MAG: UDP-N-acetylglucosamine 2-epimerase [Candidatus Scalindua brodae]